MIYHLDAKTGRVRTEHGGLLGTPDLVQTLHVEGHGDEPAMPGLVERIVFMCRDLDITSLNLYSRPYLSDLGFVADLPRLAFLHVSCERIGDLSVLAKSRRWTILAIEFTANSCFDLATLAGVQAKQLELTFSRASQCRRMPGYQAECLSVIGWKADDLTALFQGGPRRVRLQGGCPPAFAAAHPLGTLTLVDCRRLERFDPVTIQHMTISHCHKLDVRTLDRVAGLRSLYLYGTHVAEAVASLPPLPDLRDLILTFTDRYPDSLEGLDRHPLLRNVWSNAPQWAELILSARWPQIQFGAEHKFQPDDSSGPDAVGGPDPSAPG